ncbi:MAG: FAD-dependent oxidoreductase [Lachnospiraceae bacterium]|nr:FAD-dependent oxidoreductase [Lachnospiraceae bacterium]
MIKVSGLKLRPGEDVKHLRDKITRALSLDRICGGKVPQFEYKILRRSVDARKRPDIFFVYTVCADLGRQLEDKILNTRNAAGAEYYEEKKYDPPGLKDPSGLSGITKPVIIGAGPCGLFCAYILTLAGIPPIVMDRGSDIDKRTETVLNFFETGILSPECNVQFGEGGAGAFSDGKLNTSVKDRDGINRFILETFVKFGAKEEIAYDAKPHIGTDELKRVIKNMRIFMEENGAVFLFDTKMTGFCLTGERLGGIRTNDRDIMTDRAVMAIGHSARDTFEMLYEKNVKMVSKPFAVGLRLEHRQSLMNKSRYGTEYDKDLPPSDYKVTNRTKKGRNVYSFCMCPGGYVIDSSSEEGRLCINGMSFSKRDGRNCNSAIVVAVDEKDYGEGVLAGMEYQRKIEERAFALAEGKIPVLSLREFRSGNIRKDKEFGLEPCIMGRYEKADIRGVLDPEINEAIIESIDKWNESIEGFNDEDAVLSAVEARTSSPVRIIRNEAHESCIRGLYAAGEGAGYAGGIMSAAADGVRTAGKLLESYNKRDGNGI